MLCAIDVGNRSTMIGVYSDKRWLASWKVSTEQNRTVDELRVIIAQLFSLAGLDTARVRASAICNSVPPIHHILDTAIERLFNTKALWVGPGVKTGIHIRTDNPREVGSDRITNSVAAYSRYGGPVIIIDFSTATIFDCISEVGEYLGNAIAPGIGISAEALYLSASKLARVELDRPRSAVGKNTVESLQSGLIYGYSGLINGLISRLTNEIGAQAKIIATGDIVPAVIAEIRRIDAIEPELSLEGLRLIYDMNRQ